ICSQARIEILSEQCSYFLARLGVQQVEPLPGCADRIGFLCDECTAILETLGGAGKGECYQQARQSIDCGLDCAESGEHILATRMQSRATEQPSCFQEQQYAQEQCPGE